MAIGLVKQPTDDPAKQPWSPSIAVGRRESTSTQVRNEDRVGLQARAEDRHTADSLPRIFGSLGARSRNLRFHVSTMQACSNERHVVWPIGLGRRVPIPAPRKCDGGSAIFAVSLLTLFIASQTFNIHRCAKTPMGNPLAKLPSDSHKGFTRRRMRYQHRSPSDDSKH